MLSNLGVFAVVSRISTTSIINSTILVRLGSLTNNLAILSRFSTIIDTHERAGIAESLRNIDYTV